MSHFLKTLMLAVALIGWAALPAYAEPGAGEGGEDDISAKVQKQMEKIIELMEKNEQALLTLSTGSKAVPKAVDVKPPEGDAVQPPDEGAAQPPEGQDGEAGSGAGKELDELIRSQRKAGGSIPGELEELVRMVPL